MRISAQRVIEVSDAYAGRTGYRYAQLAGVRQGVNSNDLEFVKNSSHDITCQI